ncbi:protein PLASTID TRANSCRIPTIONALLY ACTIVE 10-like [Glycine soja]|uniref:Protein PLASTID TRANSCRIPTIONALLY ACTIVE 10 n=2 Tax=Glycine soja TaxID=3848 RepID=A0A445L2I7_GLYSO|nr:protein PLASTID TRANSCRIPTIONALLY ACTIVE 10-like [Glycine soja]RZC17331.1 Protein PLASTID TRANSCRIPTIONALLY ACTIVE 10 [Glycine soja]
MQVLQTSYLFTFPKPLNPSPQRLHHRLQPFLHHRHRRPLTISKSFSSDEFPVDETFLENFGPKDKETEDEARRRNWIERGWAPWEEILTPEADFARKSLNEGEEVPLRSPEAIEAFKMLNPNYRKKKREEMGLTEEEFYAKQFEIKGEIPDPLVTTWAGPLVVRLVAPRDWPPRGWCVDREELAFIREAHRMQARRVRLEEVESGVRTDTDDAGLDRYKVFLKQYKEWVEANKDRLEVESYKQDQDYYPGRRKRGKDYKEGMYELPFYYPGQICVGKVTMLHLYQGAFVDIGGVHDGWVPIKNNDWYWLRHHIKVGMHVIVEITAKRDPYRFRFPIELRLVDPNIDHLIFNKFDFAPIFHRDEDTNEDEIRRDCGRPPVPRKDPGDRPEEEPLLSNHPYVEKLWQINVAEQMILDDMAINPDKYEGKKLSDLVDEEDFDEQNAVEYTKVQYKNTMLPQTTLKTSVKELDLEAALAERELHLKLRTEAEDRGEKYKITKLRRNVEMDEYDYMHWRRSFEERETLIRDISCRKVLGLPLEEPGRYMDASFFGKDQYDPTSPLYRYDYWGEPKNSEKSMQERMTDIHNKKIVGKGNVWYEMSYEDCIKQQMESEAQSKEQENDEDTRQGHADEDEDDNDDDDFDFSILSSFGSNFSEQPHVNGTESSTISSGGMFED